MPNCCPPCVSGTYGPGIDPNTLALGSIDVGYRDEGDPLLFAPDPSATPCSLAATINLNYQDVYVLPNSSDYILYRRKWNYVKNLYSPGYRIDDESGDWIDNREEYLGGSVCTQPGALPLIPVPNMAYWLDYNKFQGQFYEDLFNWTGYAQSRGTNAAIFERWMQWKYKNGTIAYGNLPQHKRNDHVGHCWMLCPYDENNTIERTRALLGLTPDQDPVLPGLDPEETLEPHGSYYMKTASRGNVWGFECTSSECPYLIAIGTKYFYS